MNHSRKAQSPMLGALLTLSLGLLVLGFYLLFKIFQLLIWCLVVSGFQLKEFYQGQKRRV